MERGREQERESWKQQMSDMVIETYMATSSLASDVKRSEATVTELWVLFAHCGGPMNCVYENMCLDAHRREVVSSKESELATVRLDLETVRAR